MTYMSDVNGPIQSVHGQKFFDLQLFCDGALHLTIPSPMSCGGDDVLVGHLRDVLAQLINDDVLARFDNRDQPKQLAEMLRSFADKIEEIVVPEVIEDQEFIKLNNYLIKLLFNTDARD